MPRYLTLTEVVVNLVLYGGVGWWLGGRWGVATGIAILLALCVRAILAAASESSQPQERGGFGSSAAAQAAAGSKDPPERQR